MVSTRLTVLAVAVASILNGAAAWPHRARHVDKHARAVIVETVRGPTVQEYVVVDQNGNTISVSRTTIYPATTSTPKTTSKKSKPKPKTTTPKTTSSVVQAPEYNPAPEVPTTVAEPAPVTTQAPVYSATPSPSSSPAPVGDSYDTASLGKGLVYSPYHNDGTCKDQQTVRNEMKQVFGSGEYSWVRTYGADCSQVKSIVGGAYQLGIKVMLGIYHLDTQAGFDSELALLISQMKEVNAEFNKASTDWSVIALVSIGNERVNGNPGAESYWVGEVLRYSALARTSLRACGYTGSVGTADVWHLYSKYPQLCGEDEIVPINMHPFFDQSCPVSNSGTFLKNKLAEIQSVCGSNKKVIIVETGWPNAGGAFFQSIPGQAQQAEFIQLAAANLQTYILLSAFNEGWKAETSSAGVEKFWGIYGNSPSN
ncbi:hypothetical protein ABW19_dt0207012 [Dactylella cylindrospora]|nr:hypothetical protein ABW19_dt0207012 [Dactylella cylindrospora]